MRKIQKTWCREKAEVMAVRPFTQTQEKSKDQRTQSYILLFQESKCLSHRSRDRNWKVSS